MTADTAPQKLATQFEAPSIEQWRGLVDKALKGADFEKRLVAKTADGLRIPPLYTRADTRAELSPPGSAPFTRGTHASKDGFGWSILTLIDAGTPAEANRAILADLEGGSNGIVLQVAAPGQSGVSVTCNSCVSAALAGVDLDFASLQLKGGLGGAALARHVITALPTLGGKAGARQIAFNLDPIGTFAQYGTAGAPVADAITEAISIAQSAHKAEPQARTVLANGRVAHEAGGSEAQELAVLAASLVAYLRAFEKAGVKPAEALAQITVELAADTDIFLTTAKLRAARTIVARIADASGAADAAGKVAFTAVTSERMMARRDPWTNMLRTTAACAAAAFGGADQVLVLPFAHALGTSDGFARRIARNTQIIAQEESALGRINDPAGGSWYVEQVTAELAAKAWSEFQAIEAAGGIVAALESGKLQDQIAAVRDQRAKAIATGKLELTGVSAFPLLGSDGITIAPRVPAAPVGTAVIKPLTPVRLGQAFEDLRDKADALQPKAFLAALGAISDHTGRSTWIKNQLASGGIASIASDGYDSVDAAVAAFKASGCKLAVIASSDAVYGEKAEAVAKALKAAGATHIALAGRAGDKEAEFKAAGVDRFIFAGGDMVATLAALQVLA